MSRADRAGASDSLDELGVPWRALESAWSNPLRGLRGFFSEVHHTAIGMRFLVTALVFFVLGGLEALLMRLQLMSSRQTLLGPDAYNQLFTMHGSTMMFLFAVPVMEGLSIYFVPLMVGTREAAFPRLNAFAYYTYVIGGILLYVAFLTNTAPDMGWFATSPLSGSDYSPGKRVDVWSQMITFTELSALAAAVNAVVTILKHRAPGMSIDRLPMFAWAILIQSLMIVFAMPAVMLGSLMLAMDRLVGTHFFNYAEGGDVLLWQHLFWFFGHPEVYIIFIPALGILSSLLTTFTRRELFGYPALVLSLAATGFIGFGVWVHHMFATGIPQLGSSFFTAASIAIVLPTGVQFFCWLATLWTGSLQLKTPMLFGLGFFAVFLIGGLTGVMLASVPLNWQVHDTFFVVAHFHYVLIGGAVFPLLGGIYYWYPKWTGRMLDEKLGRWNFATFFVGFNLVFFPLHILGLRGMPRRIYTYSEARGWDDLNRLATFGAFILALSVLMLLFNLWRSRRHGALAGENPWDADTLEWAAPSPPPPHNFHLLPTVSGRYALWTRRAGQPVVSGLRLHRREALVTQLLDSEPDHRTELPGPTLWPLLTALGTALTFVVVIFTPWGVVIGGVLTGIGVLGWYWPKRPHKDELSDEQPALYVRREARRVLHGNAPNEPSAPPPGEYPRVHQLDVGRLPLSAFGSRDPLWWGLMLMLAIEATMFVLLSLSYLYLRDQTQGFVPDPLPTFCRWAGAAQVVLLVLSCLPMARSSAAAKSGSLRGMRSSLGLSTLLGLAFVALRFWEFQQLSFRWDSHAHGSVFWTMLGMHLMHAIFSCLESLALLALLFVGPVEEKHLVDVTVNSIYWYFVVGMGVITYGLLYLDPISYGG
jgi:cytochrome c oxidase subunit 1/cytochrome c oxidase subunit I+III